MSLAATVLSTPLAYGTDYVASGPAYFTDPSDFLADKFFLADCQNRIATEFKTVLITLPLSNAPGADVQNKSADDFFIGGRVARCCVFD
jgi:hypothetical protein